MQNLFQWGIPSFEDDSLNGRGRCYEGWLYELKHIRYFIDESHFAPLLFRSDMPVCVCRLGDWPASFYRSAPCHLILPLSNPLGLLEGWVQIDERTKTMS
ncbi:MAG: hypothetical protein ACRBBR_16915 [Cellvibrionaceae bacterium]